MGMGGGGGGSATTGILLGFLIAQAASGGGYHNSRDRVASSDGIGMSNSMRIPDETLPAKNATEDGAQEPYDGPCYPWLHPNFECPQDKSKKNATDKGDPNPVVKASKAK